MPVRDESTPSARAAATAVLVWWFAGLSCAPLAPDYGVEIYGTGPTAVGALNDIYLRNVCVGSGVAVPCQDERTISIQKVTLSDPSVVSIESASGAGPIVIRALRAGVTDIEVTVDRDGSPNRSTSGVLEISDPRTIEVEALCNRGNPDPILVPQGKEWTFAVDLLGPRPGMSPTGLTVLAGREIMPFALGTLDVIESGRSTNLATGSLLGTSSATFRVRAEDRPSSTAITTELDPAFSRVVRTFTKSDLDGFMLYTTVPALEVHGTTTSMSVDVLDTIGGDRVCWPVDRIGGTVTTETPDVCSLTSGGGGGSSVTLVGARFDVWARAMGACHVTMTSDDGRAPQTLVIDVRDSL